MTLNKRGEVTYIVSISRYMKPTSMRGGVVQLKIGQEWVTVSHHGINPKAINLICKDFGFHRNIAPRY